MTVLTITEKNVRKIKYSEIISIGELNTNGKVYIERKTIFSLIAKTTNNENLNDRRKYLIKAIETRRRPSNYYSFSATDFLNHFDKPTIDNINVYSYKTEN